MNRVTKFLRGRLGHSIEMRATPALRFVHDETFAEAERMSRLLNDPRVRRDVEAPDEDASEPESEA